MIKNEQILLSKIPEKFSYFNLKETSLKRRKKDENHRQVGCHHKLEERKNFNRCPAWDLNLRPLNCEANVLSTELSNQMTCS